MNDWRQVERDAQRAVQRILTEVGVDRVESLRPGQRVRPDLAAQARAPEGTVQLAVEAKSRITPQTAIAVCEQLRKWAPPETIPLIYAPVISPRVAEIAEQLGVGYVDQAGNCRLRSAKHGLLIERRGFTSSARPPARAVDVFSPKSSRVVRALLTQPTKGWQVRGLAEHPEVGVSVGLVSKVKQALLQEGYAIQHAGLVYLRDPIGLLRDWAKVYPGPAEQVPMYFRGEAEAAERAVRDWCRDQAVAYALAGFSAAWRLAPEVRYRVAAVYVDSQAFDDQLLSPLGAHRGGKRVDTGPNLLLWRPYDRSVLAGCHTMGQTEMPITSAIQTFLDLKRMPGRGEEAAGAVYEKWLEREFSEAAERIREMQNAAV